jgi:hypothetical protein
MDDRLIPPPDDRDQPKIADAEALFRDTPVPPPQSPAGPGAAGAEGHYEVEDLPELLPDDRPGVKAPTAAGAKESRPGLEASEEVDQVWTRWDEWSGTIFSLVVAGLALFVVLYMLVAFDQYGLAFLAFLAGGAGLAFLSYPILITLERPVRVTPEQALRDYFTALSHHFPHYKRMWLLLSSAGRVSSEFASFEGFRAYWKRRLAELRAGRASEFTPLKFKIEDFQSEKSVGKSEMDVKFVLKVSIRGRQQEGPFESFRIETALVKGPDRMWYLKQGTLL